MEQVVANIYASCLSAEAEPNGELVDLTISAIQDGLAGSNKDETLGLIFDAVEELGSERKQKGALFRIKLTSIASSAKLLPPHARSVLLKSLSAMREVAQQQSLMATLDTIKLMSEAISKVDTNTAVGQPSPPPIPHVVKKAPPATEDPQPRVQLTLIEYLKQHATHAVSDKIAFAPDIPLKKLSGALVSIGAYVKPEEVVVLVDDTVFGGSKEGVFITKDRIFIKEKFIDLAIYRLDSIHHIGADGLKIFINHREIVGLTQPDKPDMESLFAAINDYLALIRQKSNPPAPSPRPSMDYEEEEGETPECEPQLDALHGHFYFTAFKLHPTSEMSQDEWYERMLIVDLVNASMGLYQFMLRNGLEVDDQGKWISTSDLMHFESLIYAIELLALLLAKNTKMPSDIIGGYIQFIYESLMITYIDTFESRDVVEEQLHMRANYYRTAIKQKPSELPNIYHACLTNPAGFLAMGEDVKNYLEEIISNLELDCLGEEISFAFMREMSRNVESAVDRYWQNIGMRE